MPIGSRLSSADDSSDKHHQPELNTREQRGSEPGQRNDGALRRRNSADPYFPNEGLGVRGRRGISADTASSPKRHARIPRSLMTLAFWSTSRRIKSLLSAVGSAIAGRTRSGPMPPFCGGGICSFSQGRAPRGLRSGLRPGVRRKSAFRDHRRSDRGYPITRGQRYNNGIRGCFAAEGS